MSNIDETLDEAFSTAELPGEAVGMIMGLVSATGQNLSALIETLHGFGLITIEDDGVAWSLNDDFADSTMIRQLVETQYELMDLYSKRLLPLVPGYEDFVAKAQEVKGAGRGA